MAIRAIPNRRVNRPKNHHQHLCQLNVEMVIIMMNQNCHVSISTNAYNIQIYAIEMLCASIDWVALIARVVVDSIEVDRNVIQKMIQLKPQKKQTHRLENRTTQAYHPIIGYVINALNMLTVTEAFAVAKKAGEGMALNVFTTVRMIQFGKMIDV